eukprot:5466710-Amphidinium_carterae.1
MEISNTAGLVLVSLAKKINGCKMIGMAYHWAFNVRNVATWLQVHCESQLVTWTIAACGSSPKYEVRSSELCNPNTTIEVVLPDSKNASSKTGTRTWMLPHHIVRA